MIVFIDKKIDTDETLVSGKDTLKSPKMRPISPEILGYWDWIWTENKRHFHSTETILNHPNEKKNAKYLLFDSGPVSELKKEAKLFFILSVF